MRYQTTIAILKSLSKYRRRNGCYKSIREGTIEAWALLRLELYYRNSK